LTAAAEEQTPDGDLRRIRFSSKSIAEIIRTGS
jgi:hypothetical protein